MLRKSLLPVLWLYPLFILLTACSSNSAPSNNQYWHSWKKGDSLNKLSTTYGVSINTLRQSNEIYDIDDISIGTKILIPGRAPSQTVASTRPSPLLNGIKQQFIWPARGTISSGFGLRHGRMHQGVDLTKDKGKEIFAAANGIVHRVGKLKGYGNTVIIDHGSGIKTLYAHNKKTFVQKGMKINQGTVIAEMGSSGKSTGIHLHFEIRVHGKAENPLRFLPLR